MIDLRLFITVSQAAKRKGITRARIHQLIKAGRLPVTNIAGRRFVKVHDLDALVALRPGPKRTK